MQNIFDNLKSSGLEIPDLGVPVGPLSDDAANTYHQAMQAFHSACFNINEVRKFYIKQKMFQYLWHNIITNINFQHL